ncbi:MAG: protein translocase subunit SecD [Ignavibacteriae bacterium]|nr:protein translocase subunit SecD [Ignavibacteria bacterium]MBI3364679.1 protein translocase subunit SecD [Ignavibacteriota bacterium]
MKKNRGKSVFIVACVLISLYFLYPTYKDYKFGKELRNLNSADSLKFVDEHGSDLRDARTKRIKLGLDLQGGMRVVLEVNTLKLLEDLAKNKDDLFNSIMNEVRAEMKAAGDQDVIDILQQKFQARQVRLSRYYGSIRDSDNDIVSKLRDESTNAVDRAKEIVRNRVDQYGVSEPSIQKQGARRIIVELPGVSKEEEVRKLLQGTALLEFKLLIDPEIALKVYESVDKVLAGKPLADSLTADSSKSLASKSSTAKTDTAKSAADSALANISDDKTKALEQAKKDHPFFAIANPFQQEGQAWSGQLYSAEEDRARVMRILDQPDIKRLLPSDMSFTWSAKSSFTAEGKPFFALYAVKKNPELTGGVIVNARATIDPQFNTPIVEMEMNGEGAHDWARITGANIKKRIAIIMDNACFSAPVVQNKITGGRSQISGMDNVEEAKLLEIVLKAGALPAPVEIIQQATVGPSLGEDSINKGIWSATLALALTVVFMIFYYRSGGMMADIALFLNILFVLGVLAAFQGTLTLPGIAGLILTVAIAVDANVLIFERIREESVTGKSLMAAIDAGYSRAFTAIFDANLTAFITGVILYQFGSGPVQGFALTLMIGIVASVFSAVVVSRVIIETMLERGKHVSFG